MHKYKLISKKGEGTFSEVLKAQTQKNKLVAIKRMKNHFESLEQVNSLREVQALRRLSPHPGIIKLLEVIFERPTGRLSLVFELMDMNIYELIRGRRHYLPEKKVKAYMYQLLKAMDHMHRNGVFHRDIKPENILVADDRLKIADFGSCRGLKSKQPFTEYISTRWYRAPECLLTDGYYTYKMDIWGVGCVFFEVMSLFPLFPGTNELDQIQKIHNILGTPSPELLSKMKRSSHMNFNFPSKEGTGIERLLPNASPECIDLIKKLLAYNPDERLSARQALRYPYFRDLREAEKRAKHGMFLYTTLTDPPNPASGDGTSSSLPDGASLLLEQKKDMKIGGVGVASTMADSSSMSTVKREPLPLPTKNAQLPPLSTKFSTLSLLAKNELPKSEGNLSLPDVQSLPPSEEPTPHALKKAVLSLNNAPIENENDILDTHISKISNSTTSQTITSHHFPTKFTTHLPTATLPTSLPTIYDKFIDDRKDDKEKKAILPTLKDPKINGGGGGWRVTRR
eukprot:TRINITY_DN3203_c0_g1_i2.p1 TRINITY_DN3203_c0_g1~~TRINITY_DN3203_c0_g1_i2.p1  ORF type:complete len:511 (-),score=85.64 TRINITY_DN3203_c0_g1_i2:3-1535(-)